MGIIEPDGTFSQVSKKLAEILGTDISSIVTKPFIDWVYEADREILLAYYNARDSGENDIPDNYKFRLMTQNGDIRWVLVHASFFKETGITIVSILDIDIFKQTQLKLERSIASQNAVFNAVPDLMFELDSNGRYINIWANNPQELARNKEMLLGKTVSDVLPLEVAKIVMSTLSEAEKVGKSFGKHIQVDTPDGVLWFELSVSRIERESTLKHFILLSRNITQRKHLEEQLKELSHQDTLTSLYNRRKLEMKLSKDIYNAHRYEHSLSLLMLDIDHFKNVNDTYGHQVGDDVLVAISKLLKELFRETDEAFRYGGEEFVVILQNTTLSEAKELAERLRKKVQETSINISNGDKISLTISIGVSNLTKQIKSGDELINIADARMYAAKKIGRNSVVSSDYIEIC